MTPFAIVGTVYLILLAICFAVSAASLAVIAWKMPKRVEHPLSAAIRVGAISRNEAREMNNRNSVVYTSWPTKNGDSVEHGEG